MGGGNLLIKNVSRDKSLFRVYWGNALLLLAVSGVVLLGAVVAVAHLILPATIPLLLVVLICLSRPSRRQDHRHRRAGLPGDGPARLHR